MNRSIDLWQVSIVLIILAGTPRKIKPDFSNKVYLLVNTIREKNKRVDRDRGGKMDGDQVLLHAQVF